MFYRRRLPHWHPEIAEGTFLFVTFRLSGSMPVGQALSPADPCLPASHAFLLADRQLDKAATGPTWLLDSRVARTVADAPAYGETGMQYYQLRAWVIMPNHVHILLRPEAPLSSITRWMKGSTARQANLILSRTGHAFWQDESFDHRVRDEMELARIAHYVKCNPVTAGLAPNSRGWPWSSARLAGESPTP